MVIKVKNKNVVFMGTPDFAVPVLEMLIEKTNVVLVVTQPDKEVGRKKELTYSPVKKKALEHNIKVFQPNKIRLDYDILKKIDIDLIVTCAFGQILPKEVLDLPKYGSINVHASILPKYRGSAPIQWALMNGDKTTGVTIMYMDEGMDTGDIIKISEIPIENSDDVGTLHNKLSILGKNTLESSLKEIFNKTNDRVKQGENYSLAPKIRREDEHIDFNDYGNNIINKIRALSPWPLANIVIDGLEIKIIKARFEKSNINEIGKIVVINKDNLGISCLDGIIYLEKIKPMGKKVMDIKSYLNGINKNMLLEKEVK